MKKDEHLIRYSSIPEIHKAFCMPNPQHPLISLSYFDEDNPMNPNNVQRYDVLDFYKITFILEGSGKLKYGQHYYDYDDGGMMFLAPNQLVGTATNSGGTRFYILLFHPDFLQGYPLAQKIKTFSYFSYEVSEALHLSEAEKQTMLSVYRILESELKGRIDEFTQEVIIAQVELLLSYVNRFYKRQFITRKSGSEDLLQKAESVIDEYFRNDLPLNLGLPSVQYLAGKLNISAGYLSDMLRSLIGKSAKQYIHEKLIDKAKEKLSTTNHAIAEIAYELGFEHSQSFSKLFKQKTNESPVEFRAKFN